MKTILMRLSRLFLILLTIILALALYSPAAAQDEVQDEPYYIVKAGDSLWQIAAHFGVIVEDSQQANNIVVVIDHGWGVYTAYDHLSEILVQSGQLIGLSGDTGRTTGPHLHSEVWVGGVQVNPVDWLSTVSP